MFLLLLLRGLPCARIYYFLHISGYKNNVTKKPQNENIQERTMAVISENIGVEPQHLDVCEIYDLILCFILCFILYYFML